MNKQTTASLDDRRFELQAIPCHETMSKKRRGKTALDPEQAAAIRSFAEYIVRQLCERDSYMLKDKAFPF